jgi:hypothetical protein
MPHQKGDKDPFGGYGGLMKPRKIKNVKVPNRGLLSSDRSTRRKSHGGSPKDGSVYDGGNTTIEESVIQEGNSSKKVGGNHKSSTSNKQGSKE